MHNHHYSDGAWPGQGLSSKSQTRDPKALGRTSVRKKTSLATISSADFDSLKVKLATTKHCWERVRGLVVAVAATLYDVGWKLVAPGVFDKFSEANVRVLRSLRLGSQKFCSEAAFLLRRAAGFC